MQEAYSDWTLVSLSPWSQQWLWVACLTLAVSTCFVVRTYKGSKSWFLLTMTRLLMVLMACAILLEPALQLRMVRKVQSRLAVVMDDSTSMNLATKSSTLHQKMIRALLAQQSNLKSLSEELLIEWHTLDESSSPPSSTHKAAVRKSDIIGSLERVTQNPSNHPLAGIVLLSDGGDTETIPALQSKEMKERLHEQLRKLGVPVTVVDVIGNMSLKDLSIDDVQSDKFAFVHNTFDIEVTLSSRGFDALTLPVTLMRGTEVIATQEVALSPQSSATITFKTKPDLIGEFVYSLSLPSLAQDQNPKNNRKSFAIRVIRDKIRVLHVAGRPSWDVRFLRQHLKENPNVDLIAFFILRTPTDDVSVSQKELSLIPFPVNKLFTTELSSFDVVIFQNFDYGPYNMAQYLPNIRDAVKEGLGFVMIGGEQSFGTSYLGTALGEVLSADLNDNQFIEGLITPRLSAYGKSHPVTRLVRDMQTNIQLWDKLPPWVNVNRTPMLQPGALSLLEATIPSDAGAQMMPLLSVLDVGKGRSMSIHSSSMWRWRFTSHPNRSQSERAYHRFWSNALRWLVRDPEHSRIQITLDRRFHAPKDPIDLTLKVLNQDYQTLAKTPIQLQLHAINGTETLMDEVQSNEEGIAKYTYENLKEGAYRVKATLRNNNRVQDVGESVFIVGTDTKEMSLGKPNASLLKSIARFTDGHYRFLEDDFLDDLPLSKPEVVEVDKRRHIDFWDNGWAMFVILLLFCADWALRRSRGYF
jgi:uncharacterized membrane protein